MGMIGSSTNPRFELYSQFLDPFGPIKYDEMALSRVIAVLPELAGRLEAIETHLASDNKQPFVRAADRVGTEGIARSLEAVTKRLDSIEQRLSQKG